MKEIILKIQSLYWWLFYNLLISNCVTQIFCMNYISISLKWSKFYIRSVGIYDDKWI